MKPRKNRRFALTNPLVLCLLMLVLTTPLPASAAMYDYTYTGPAFDQFTGTAFDTPGIVYRIEVRFRYGALAPGSVPGALPVTFTTTDGEHSSTSVMFAGVVWQEEYVSIGSVSAAGLPTTWGVRRWAAPGWEWETSCGIGGSLGYVGYDWSLEWGSQSAPPESSGIWGGDLVEPRGWNRTEVVPLPPSALLLGAGLIPLAWARRKKRMGK